MSEFMTLVENENACAEAVEWGLKELNIDRRMLLGDHLDTYLIDDTKNQMWVVWLMTTVRDSLGPDIRELLLHKITDPMAAFTLYTDVPDLTAKEDELLEVIFTGKIPRAEEELTTGVVVRQKTG